MYPAIHIGQLSIPCFGLFVFLGIVACGVYLFVTLKCIERVEKQTLIKTFAVFIPSLILLYVFATMFDALFHSIREKRFVSGGITWEGGIVGGFTAFILLTHFFVREQKGNALEYFSLLVPGIVLGHAFGRVGCFMGGCCFGKISFTMGVKFPEGSLADLQYPNNVEGSLPVLPTQLYEAAFELILFAVMLILYKKFKRHNLEIYCLSYGVFRFILEFFRGDDRGATGFFLSPSQFMSVVLVIAGVLIILYHKKILFKKLSEKAAEWRRTAVMPTKANTPDEIYQSIDKLKELYENGAITEEEFEHKKQELLARL